MRTFSRFPLDILRGDSIGKVCMRVFLGGDRISDTMQSRSPCMPGDTHSECSRKPPVQIIKLEASVSWGIIITGLN